MFHFSKWTHWMTGWKLCCHGEGWDASDWWQSAHSSLFSGVAEENWWSSFVKNEGLWEKFKSCLLLHLGKPGQLLREVHVGLSVLRNCHNSLRCNIGKVWWKEVSSTAKSSGPSSCWDYCGIKRQSYRLSVRGFSFMILFRVPGQVYCLRHLKSFWESRGRNKGTYFLLDTK